MAQGAGYFRPRPRGDGIRTVREVSAGGVMYRKHSDEIQIALIHVRNRWGLPYKVMLKKASASKKPLCEKCERRLD